MDTTRPKPRSSIPLVGTEAQRGSKTCTNPDTVKAQLTQSPACAESAYCDLACAGFNTHFDSSGFFLPVPKHRTDPE